MGKISNVPQTAGTTVPGPDIVRIDRLKIFLDSMGGGAWPFLEPEFRDVRSLLFIMCWLLALLPTTTAYTL